MPPSPIILISSYWLMRTPGCGAASWLSDVTAESSLLLPALRCPVSAWRSHFDEPALGPVLGPTLGPTLGPSLARRLRAATVTGTGCGSGVACGIVVGGFGSGMAPLGPRITLESAGPFS